MSISSLMLNYDELDTLVFTENIFKDIKKEVESRSPYKQNTKDFDITDDYRDENDSNDICMYGSNKKFKKEKKNSSCERKVEIKVKRNERERRRVKQLADGFKKLRNVVPAGDERKLSKLDTLRIALDYISDLKTTLETYDGNQNGAFQVVPQFNPPTPTWTVPPLTHLPTSMMSGQNSRQYTTPETFSFRNQFEAMESFCSY